MAAVSAPCNFISVKAAALIPGVGMCVGGVAQWMLSAAESEAKRQDNGNNSYGYLKNLSEIRLQQAHYSAIATVRNCVTVAILATIVALGVISGPVSIALIVAAVVFGLFALYSGVRSLSSFSEAHRLDRPVVSET